MDSQSTLLLLTVLPVCDVLLQLFDGKKVILIHFENFKGIHLSTLLNQLVPLLRGKDLGTLPFLRFYATEVPIIRKVRMTADHKFVVYLHDIEFRTSNNV